MKNLTINQFKGIHNTNPPRSIPDNALVDAVDVDLNDAGNLLERLGAAKVVDVPISSAYSMADGTAFIVSQGTLNRVGADLGLIPLAASTATEFADQDGILFTNDGLMVRGADVINLVVPAPPAPSVTVVPGNFPEGRYSVVATNHHANGLLSATSRVITVDCPAGKALMLRAEETPGFTPDLWMTEANGDLKTGGEVFYNSIDGSILPEINLKADSFPGGYLVEWFDSRLYLAEAFNSYTIIRFSHRHHYHLFDHAENFFIVPDRVHAMKATANALVLACHAHIYAYDGQNLITLAEYGSPEGRCIAKFPDHDALLIHTHRGACRFPDFQNLTEKIVSLPSGGHCSTQIVYHRGMQQFVALNDGGTAFNPFTKKET